MDRSERVHRERVADGAGTVRTEIRQLLREVRRAPLGEKPNAGERQVLARARRIVAQDRHRKTAERKKRQSKLSRRKNR